MKKQLTTLTILFFFLNQTSFASPFRVVGSRALGVGGAFVAVADGVDAQYWNPAGLGLNHGSGFQIPVNASFEATGNLLEKADAISEAAEKLSVAKEAQENGTDLTLEQVRDTADALNKILDLNSTGTGALIDAGTGLQTRFGHVAVSFNQYVDLGMLPIVDPSLSLGALTGHAGSGVELGGDGSGPSGNQVMDDAALALAPVLTQLGVTFSPGTDVNEAAYFLVSQANSVAGLTPTQIQEIVDNTVALTGSLPADLATGGDLHDNETRVNLTGASMSEVALGYGHTIPFPSNWGTLSAGGNLKAIRGQVGFASVLLTDGEDTSVSDSIDDARTNIKTTVQPAVDLGLLYRLPFGHLTQFGLLGRNLNSPEFDMPENRFRTTSGKYKEAAQVRAGMAFWPMKRWMLSADVDVTDNKTSIPGFTSQMWGAGSEFKIWLLDLRAGLMKNFGSDTPLTYTGGFGLNFGAFKINASGAMSSKTVRLETDGTEVPASLQVGLSIGLVFGQGQEEKVKHDNIAEPESQVTPAVESTPTQAVQENSPPPAKTPKK